MTAAIRDVTERKQAEAALRKHQERVFHTDRLSSLGALAAGVAHEINNPLAYVMVNLELVAEEIRELAGTPLSSRMTELANMVSEARHGAERVRKIVRGLRTFSRADAETRVVLDLQAVLETSINMVLHEIKHRARLVKDYHPVPLVEADEARLGQVFVNLLVNGAQAIREGQADRNELRIITRTNHAGGATVEIRDTGGGIDPEALERIFDPFFTTKTVGIGTGLGLAICHGIVTALGGEIGVESTLGKGAAFTVTLPPAKVRDSVPAVSRSLAVSGGSRVRILIIMLVARTGLGGAHLMRGNLELARMHFEEGLRVYDPKEHAQLAFLFGQDCAGMCASFLTWVHAFDGNETAANAAVQRSLEICAGLNQHPGTRGFVECVLATYYNLVGDYATAAAYSQSVSKLGQEQGMPHWAAQGEINLGWAMQAQGQPDGGIPKLAGGIAGLLGIGTGASMSLFYSAQAEAELRRGAVDEALTILETAANHVARADERCFESEVRRLKAKALLKRGGPSSKSEAEAELREAVAISTRQGATRLAQRAQAELATLDAAFAAVGPS